MHTIYSEFGYQQLYSDNDIAEHPNTETPHTNYKDNLPGGPAPPAASPWSCTSWRLSADQRPSGSRRWLDGGLATAARDPTRSGGWRPCARLCLCARWR
jgi:hypothetical protein